ncbi:hypothetical protein EJ04DRAFT_603765 [Polyplosphaeria fusca]|uniref:Uncharacterized protein n=1 Tax=Polyplosphaeria fusca TaxID=682080 RepID=A0A9P4QZU6_9PLEO|nr:hypothetical protein EJ04DRAFT_603765 [Polyplosphaeria fusca]
MPCVRRTIATQSNKGAFGLCRGMTDSGACALAMLDRFVHWPLEHVAHSGAKGKARSSAGQARTEKSHCPQDETDFSSFDCICCRAETRRSMGEGMVRLGLVACSGSVSMRSGSPFPAKPSAPGMRGLNAMMHRWSEATGGQKATMCSLTHRGQRWSCSSHVGDCRFTAAGTLIGTVEALWGKYKSDALYCD